MPPLILADENIPCVREAFGELGELRTMPGRAISREHAIAADVLLVRSVTRVDSALLEGSRVRFIGTATIGSDHIDLPWLRSRGIEFASAPGSNAESVAQYVAAALCFFRARDGRKLRGRTIGVVGAGNCGSRVARVSEALGMQPVLCDPPLARATGDPRYRPLAELSGCDLISLHVPLSAASPDRTLGLIDAAFLAAMRPGAVLLHVCRGGVVDEEALIHALRARKIAGAAIDVWKGEPRIDFKLLAEAAIATPHIAGYSLDGKLKGAEMIYEALCRWLGRPADWPAAARPPEIIREVAAQPPGEGGGEEFIARLVEEAYPIRRDDAALRALASLPAAERAAGFDALRRDYPERREFSATRVALDPPAGGWAERLRLLGFAVAQG